VSESTRTADGPTLAGLVVGDEPGAWRAAGFDVAGDLLTTGGLTLRFAGADGPRGVLRWALAPPVGVPCDGLAAAAAGEVPDPDAPGADPAGVVATRPLHPNGVVGLDHVVVTTDDVERTTVALGRLGLEPRRTIVGVRGDGDDEVAYRFFLLGTCLLELVGPTAPTGDGPARFAGLAFTSTSVEELGDLAGSPRDAVQPGRRIATLRGDDLGISVPVAFLSPRPGRTA
jgi:hypothetical protein